MADKLRIHISSNLLADPLVYACYRGDHTAEELILDRLPDWRLLLKPPLASSETGHENGDTLFASFAHRSPGSSYDPDSGTFRGECTLGSTTHTTESEQPPKKSKNQTVLHAAAYYGNKAFLQSALELPQIFIKELLQELPISVRRWANNKDVSVMAGAAPQLFQEDEALQRSSLPDVERERIEKAKGMQKKFVTALEDVERLKMLHKEVAYQSMLTNVDALGRTPLHYGGAAKESLSCDTLLSMDTFGGTFDGYGMSGRPLFPRNKRICLVTGQILNDMEGDHHEKNVEFLPSLYQQTLEWCEHALHRAKHPHYSNEMSERELILTAFVSIQGLEDRTNSRLKDDPTLGGSLSSPPSVSFTDIMKQRRRLVKFPESVIGGAPLHVAALHDNVRAIRCLLHYGADPLAEVEGGLTPIDLATEALAKTVQNPLRKAVQQACGLSLHSKEQSTDGQASLGDTSRLTEQFSMGVSARSRGVAGGIPLGTGLHAAAEYGQSELVHLFVENGADVNDLDANGMSPLMIAAAHARGGKPYLDVAQELLNMGADVNATSSLQRTVLHFTAAAVSFPVSKAERTNPVPHHRDDTYQDSSDHCIGSLLSLFINAGAIIDSRDHRGDTPLHYAAHHNNFIALDVLLKFGAYPYAKNSLNNTALHSAAFMGGKESLRLLARYDCEFGVLKSLRNSQNKYGFDIAKSDEVRRSMDTIWECAAAGKLNKIHQMFRLADVTRNRFGEHQQEGHPQSKNVSGELVGMWRIQQPWETTRILRRTVFHCLVTGCARKRRELWMKFIDGKSTADRINLWTDFRHIEVGIGGTKGVFARGTSGSTKGISLRSGSGLPCVTGPIARSISGVRQPNDPDLQPPTPSSANVEAGIGVCFNRYGQLDTNCILNPEKRARDKKFPGVTVDWQDAYNKDAELQRHYGRIATVMLKQADLDPDVADVDGVTPLMLCARYGLCDLMKSFINIGANLIVQDSNGNTALHWAYAYGQRKACNFLEELDLNTSEQNQEVEANEDNYQHRRRNCQLLNIRNHDSSLADEVRGDRLGILPSSSERFLEIRPPPLESDSLCVSHTEELSQTTFIKAALHDRTMKLETTRRGS